MCAWSHVTDVAANLGALLDAASAKFLELGNLGRNATALDLGCGDGALAGQAAAMFGKRGLQIIGLDTSPEMIATAQRTYGATAGLQFQVADATQQVFASDSCDAAFCRFSLPFLADPVGALWSAFHMLKPGGRMCVMSIADGEHNDFINVLEGLGEPIVAHVLRWGRQETIAHQLEALGYQQVLTKRIRALVTVEDPAAYWSCIRGLYGFPNAVVPPTVAARVPPGTRLQISIVFAVGKKPDPAATAKRQVQSGDDAVALARRKSREISATSISQMFKGEQVVFLDVRAPATRVSKIKDSLHVTRDDLEERLPGLVPDAGKAIVVYCDQGNQSALATGQLRAMGYTNVWSLQRGLAGWEYVGMKVVPA